MLYLQVSAPRTCTDGMLGAPMVLTITQTQIHKGGLARTKNHHHHFCKIYRKTPLAKQTELGYNGNMVDASWLMVFFWLSPFWQSFFVKTG
ncbi:MAG: hypothetical protein K0U45_01495 [Alphaproteobacteria bacterium]|nr:hypothetical protein [Alphaproteobacteria bacterium]